MNKSLILLGLCLSLVFLSGCSSDELYIFGNGTTVSGSPVYVLNVSNNPYSDWWIAFPDFTVKINASRTEGLKINYSDVLNVPSSYNYSSDIALKLSSSDQRYNDTALITPKLDVSDQRYNNTALIGAVNTSANIESLGFNTTTKLKSYFDTLYLTSVPSNLQLTSVNITGTSRLIGDTVFDGGTTVYNATLDQFSKLDLYEHDFYFKMTDFESVTAVYNTPWVLGAIASGTAPLIAGVVNHPGIVQFTTSSTASSGYTYNIAGATTYSLSAGLITEIVFRPYTKGTDVNATVKHNLTNIKFGFTDVITGADAVDGVYFNISQFNNTNTSLNVSLIGSSASSRVTNMSSTQLVNNTWYSAKVYINSTSLATGIIYSESGAEVLRLTVSTVPNGVGRETSESVLCWVSGGTVAVKVCDVDLLSVGFVGRLVR